MVHSSLAAKMLPAPQTVRLCSVTSPPRKTERPVADAFGRTERDRGHASPSHRKGFHLGSVEKHVELES